MVYDSELALSHAQRESILKSFQLQSNIFVFGFRRLPARLWAIDAHMLQSMLNVALHSCSVLQCDERGQPAQR